MSHSTQNWTNFFTDFNVYTNSLRLQIFIDTLLEYGSYFENPSYLEIASGSGATVQILRDIGLKVDATDVDDKVLTHLNQYLRHHNFNIPAFKLNVLESDPSTIDHYDISFHQGLLEHFSDQEIITALTYQSKISNCVVFDVPNNRDKIQHYGDERFLTLRQWKLLIDQSNLNIVEVRGRMFPKIATLLPHMLHKSKRNSFIKYLQKKLGSSYVFVCKPKA